MKNFFGYFALAILISAGVFMFRSQKQQKMDVLRVAFPYSQPVTAYEPTKIHLAPQYIFLENVYSSLVEISPKEAELIGGVADKFYWKDDELILEIRKSLKTASGAAITADDVLFSLKRLLVLSGNTHGNFKDLVCPNQVLTNVEQDCSGIMVRDGKVVLKAGSRKAFLLPMLAAIDFAVIPKSSVDPITLDISDYGETSGPYYVESDDTVGNIILAANPNHYRYSKDLPQKIKLVPTDSADKSASLRAFKENKIDFITTIDQAKPEEILDLAKSENGGNLHRTMNIRSFVLTFTERGLSELTQQQRLSLGRTIRKAMRDAYRNKTGYEISSQFFPASAEGSLSQTELETIERSYETSGEAPKIPLSMTVVRVGPAKDYQEILRYALPSIGISEGKNAPAFTKYENKSEMPHMFISGPDTAFQEDIGLISYTLSAGFFGMPEAEKEDWLSKYMSLSEKEKRIQMLRSQHFEALSKGVMVPLVVSPYVAFARKPWKIELSQYFANNPLWLIKQP